MLSSPVSLSLPPFLLFSLLYSLSFLLLFSSSVSPSCSILYNPTHLPSLSCHPSLSLSPILLSCPVLFSPLFLPLAFSSHTLPCICMTCPLARSFEASSSRARLLAPLAAVARSSTSLGAPASSSASVIGSSSSKTDAVDAGRRRGPAGDGLLVQRPGLPGSIVGRTSLSSPWLKPQQSLPFRIKQRRGGNGTRERGKPISGTLVRNMSLVPACSHDLPHGRTTNNEQRSTESSPAIKTAATHPHRTAGREQPAREARPAAPQLWWRRSCARGPPSYERGDDTRVEKGV